MSHTPFFINRIMKRFLIALALISTPVYATPAIYNSVPIEIKKTNYDARWEGTKNSPEQFSNFKKHSNLSKQEKIKLVNDWVNTYVTYKLDGPVDTWQTPSTTLRLATGDCEDYAILKYHILTRLGFSRNDLYIVVGKVLSMNQYHAVLAVKIDGKFYILDNMNKSIIESSTDSDFRPIASLSYSGRWIHGYKFKNNI